MGVLLILLSLVSAGALAGFIAENDLLSAPTQSFTMFGQDVNLSIAAISIVSFALGAITVILLIVGIGLLRGSWGRRRALKRRIAELEQRNLELQSRERLNQTMAAQQEDQTVLVPEVKEPSSSLGTGG
jgi:hypothetical protein